MKTLKTAEELFNVITSNGMREMTLTRFDQALAEDRQQVKDLIDEIRINKNEFRDDRVEYNKGWNDFAEIFKQELKKKI
jgi:hypothetical protein